MVVRPRGAKFELRVKHRLLQKPFYATFPTEDEARAYGQQLESMLAKGLVPVELAEPEAPKSALVSRLIRDYMASQPISALDRSILDLLFTSVGATRASAVTYSWVESWVRSLKTKQNLAPGTIRKRVGAMARLFDWHLKRQTSRGSQPLANPFRMLPVGYANYNDNDRALLPEGASPKVDTERDRRLTEDEDKAIVGALSGARDPNKERPLDLPEGDALLDLYQVIVNTGLRLREAYRLIPERVRIKERTIHVAASKTGAKRDVPIPPSVMPILERRTKQAKKGAPIFPWWDGSNDEKHLRQVTSRLSRAFSRAFEYAGCDDLTEHDLRHEATCRWMMMRDANGNWLFRAEEVMRITGHRDPRTFARYLSLRGSDLAERLW